MKFMPCILGAFALSVLVTGCQSHSGRIRYNPKLPTAMETHQFKESEHFKGFRYDPLSQTLTVIDLQGQETVFTHVPKSVAKGFMTDGGHLGYYQKSIADRYQSRELITLEERNFLPVASSQFAGVDYDAETRRLYLLTKSSQIKEFINVPPEVYRDFLNAPIKGAYYRGYIENIYEDAKVLGAAEATP